MKNLKRIRMYRLIVLMALVVAAVSFAVCFCAIAKTTYKFNGGFSDISALENMQYSLNGDDFYSFDDFESLEGKFLKNDLIIKGTINTDDFINPVLVIRTNSNYYDAFVDGENILSKEKDHIFNNFISIDFASIPEYYDGKDVEIFLFSNNPKNICKDVQIYTTNKYYLISQLFIDGLFNTLFCVFAAITGVLLLLSYISPRYRRYGLYVIGYLMLLVSIMCLFSFNKFIILLVDNLYLISILPVLCVCQVPICILLFIQRYDVSNREFKRHKMFLRFYIVLTIIGLALEILDLIYTKTFLLFIACMMFIITATCLKVLFNIVFCSAENNIITSNLELQNNYNYKTKNYHKFDSHILGKYIPILFSMFLVVNMVSIILYIIFDNTSMYIVPFSIAVTFIVIALSTVFAFDLKVVNDVVTTSQEIRLLNKNRIDLLISKQMEIFNVDNIEDICFKFINGIKEAVFPYKVNEKDELNIRTSSVREKYIKDYNVFVTSSSLVCIKKQKVYENDPEYEVFIGTGQFEGYSIIEYTRNNPTKEFEQIDAIMNQNTRFSDADVVSYVGDYQNIEGIVLIRDLDGIEPIVKSLLGLYVKTCATVIENILILSKAKYDRQDILYNLNEISELRLQQKGNHIRRICIYSRILAEKLGFSEKDTKILELAASMHDIGKIGITDKILNKPGKLTPTEFDIIKSHTQMGYESLTGINNDVILSAASIAKYHHEKYNGTGYFGLKGNQIPIGARIVAVADVFDALSVKKIYKDPWGIEKIVELFEKEKNKHFDAEIAKILIDNIDEFIAVRDKYSESYEV